MSGKYGPRGELCFFLLPQCPFCSADVLKKCALVALHFKNRGRRKRRRDGCHAPDLEDDWTLGFRKSPAWASKREAWSEDKKRVFK